MAGKIAEMAVKQQLLTDSLNSLAGWYSYDSSLFIPLYFFQFLLNTFYSFLFSWNNQVLSLIISYGLLTLFVHFWSLVFLFELSLTIIAKKINNITRNLIVESIYII
jgi:hypothetical protein